MSIEQRLENIKNDIDNFYTINKFYEDECQDLIKKYNELLMLKFNDEFPEIYEKQLYLEDWTCKYMCYNVTDVIRGGDAKKFTYTRFLKDERYSYNDDNRNIQNLFDKILLLNSNEILLHNEYKLMIFDNYYYFYTNTTNINYSKMNFTIYKTDFEKISKKLDLSTLTNYNKYPMS
jgi:hypothetical protein